MAHYLVVWFAVFVLARLPMIINEKYDSDSGSGMYDDDDEDYYVDGSGDNSSGDDYEFSETVIDTKIVTKGATYRVNLGTQIRLPCYVDKFPKTVVIMWTKGTEKQGGKKYIVVDEQIYEQDRGGISVEVVHDDDIMKELEASLRGSTLIINSATKEDEGEYVCTVAGRGSIKHTVKIGVGDGAGVSGWDIPGTVLTNGSCLAYYPCGLTALPGPNVTFYELHCYFNLQVDSYPTQPPNLSIGSTMP